MKIIVRQKKIQRNLNVTAVEGAGCGEARCECDDGYSKTTDPFTGEEKCVKTDRCPKGEFAVKLSFFNLKNNTLLFQTIFDIIIHDTKPQP